MSIHEEIKDRSSQDQRRAAAGVVEGRARAGARRAQRSARRDHCRAGVVPENREREGGAAMKKGPRGLGSTYERSGVWWIQYRIRGVRYRESSGSRKEADASRLLKKRIGDAASGRPVVPQLEKTTLEQITKMVIDDYVANHLHSEARVRYAVEHLHDFFTPEAKVIAITTDQIKA